MKLSPTGTSPSLASQSKTPQLRSGSLHFNGEKVVDPKLAQEVLEGIQKDFAKTSEEKALLEAMFHSAQNPLLGDNFHVWYRPNTEDTWGGETSIVNKLTIEGHDGYHQITEPGIGRYIYYWKMSFGKYVPEAIWDLVLPKK
jgi:hypothetical protein